MTAMRVNPRKPLTDRFAASIDVDPSGCWLWRGKIDSKGYGVINDQHKAHRAHRMSWLLSRGPIPDGLSVCHRCDVRACVNPDHLFVGTATDNNRDCWSKGRGVPLSRRADGSAPNRLNPAAVREIRGLYAEGMTQVTIAARFGVRDSTISHVITGRSWGYLP